MLEPLADFIRSKIERFRPLHPTSHEVPAQSVNWIEIPQPYSSNISLLAENQSETDIRLTGENFDLILQIQRIREGKRKGINISLTEQNQKPGQKPVLNSVFLQEPEWGAPEISFRAGATDKLNLESVKSPNQEVSAFDYNLRLPKQIPFDDSKATASLIYYKSRNDLMIRTGKTLLPYRVFVNRSTAVFDRGDLYAYLTYMLEQKDRPHPIMLPIIDPTPDLFYTMLPLEVISAPPEHLLRNLKYAGSTHPGRNPYRETNEDAIYISEADPEAGFSLFIVADGAKAHGEGGEASRILTQEAASFIKQKIQEPDFVPEIAVQEAVRKARRKMFEKAQQNPNLRGMTSTIVGALIINNRATIFHAGDSRLYHLRDSDFDFITEDDSQAMKLVIEAGIARRYVAILPIANLITNAVMTPKPDDIDAYKRDTLADDLNLHVSSIELKPGDRLLLLSDGAWGPLDSLYEERPDLIREILTRSESSSVAVQSFINEANKAGGPDNIAAIVVFVS